MEITEIPVALYINTPIYEEIEEDTENTESTDTKEA